MTIELSSYHSYLTILREELVPALGCTEPVSIAFAAAKARNLLGEMPQSVYLQLSGNIIKNAKSVKVPQSKSLKGIEAAVLLGCIGGDASRGLEVLTSCTPQDEAKVLQLLRSSSQPFCKVEHLQSPASLHLRLTAASNGRTALVEIMHQHTNIVCMMVNDTVLFDHATSPTLNSIKTDRSCLTVSGIYAFAQQVKLEDVAGIIRQQIDINFKIATEGLTHSYGANVGANLLKHYGNNVRTYARAAAAAGSDARMSGCDMPVVINSGSGNQGLAASVPVIVYAKALHVSEETLIRALVLSNLVAIHQKTSIGILSAYCGAVSAACGSGAAITYLHGGSYEQICQTIVNTLANVSGIICDGAKPSCAAKIASAIDAAILAHHLSMENEVFATGDGIIKADVEQTIRGIGKIASEGMRQTDEKILDVVLE